MTDTTKKKIGIRAVEEKKSKFASVLPLTLPLDIGTRPPQHESDERKKTLKVPVLNLAPLNQSNVNANQAPLLPREKREVKKESIADSGVAPPDKKEKPNESIGLT